VKRLWSVITAASGLLLVGPAPTALADAGYAVVNLSQVYFNGADRPVRITVSVNEEGLITLRNGLGRIKPYVGCKAVTKREVTCGAPASRYVDIQGSPLDDRLKNSATTTLGVALNGQGGNDQIIGSAAVEDLYGNTGEDVIRGWGGDDRVDGAEGNDELYGGPGNDDMRGSSGDDAVFGGIGDDVLDERTSRFDPDPAVDADILSGGDGTDAVVYDRDERLFISLDDVANDGGVDEHDNVLADVENVEGGSERDVILGSVEDNELLGDYGSDRLVGGGGHDVLCGRQGNDHLDTVDDVADRAVCGDGNDVATVDAKDHVSASCETVNVDP
jgi:Ca2+-binding RTX toxin-like protein